MSEWQPIEDASPQDGDYALILAEIETARGTLVGIGPQLCVWDDSQGVWIQMLSGDFYGLGVHGTPIKFMPVYL